MGRQINFYLSPTDTQGLEEELMKVGDPIILHSRSRGPHPRCLDSTDLIENDQRWYVFYIARKNDVDTIITKEIADQGYWRVDDMFSPVVEFTRCEFDGKTIRRGRLYFSPNYYDDDRKLVEKNGSFIEWAEKFLAKAKQFLRYDRNQDAYFGPEASEWVDSGVGLRHL